jgi:hypothetical protein
MKQMPAPRDHWIKLITACAAALAPLERAGAAAPIAIWNGASGNWSDASQWIGGVANDPAMDVVIGAAGNSIINLDLLDVHIGALSLGTGRTVALTSYAGQPRDTRRIQILKSEI